MSKELVPLYKVYTTELPEIMDIIKNGQYYSGKLATIFEKNIGVYLGNPNVLAVSSYNLAWFIAFQVLDLKPGDEVIVSPIACLASIQPLKAYGLHIKWVDVDPRTGTIDPLDLHKKISKNTKAIIHNHFCGYPGYVNEVNKVAKEYEVPVIDDGIEAFGSMYNGSLVGNIGSDITIFSFNSIRFPNTIEGAAIVFKNVDFLEKSKIISDLGVDRTNFRNYLGEINEESDVSHIGYSAKMSEINAYIGLKQLEDVEFVLKKQRLNGTKWRDYFKRNSNVGIVIENDETYPNFWVFGFLTKNKIHAIEKFRGMGFYASSVHIRNDIYSVFSSKSDNLPGVTKFSSEFVALPSGWWVDDI